MNKIVIAITSLVLIGLSGFAYVQQKNKADSVYGLNQNTEASTVSTTTIETKTQTAPEVTTVAPKSKPTTPPTVPTAPSPVPSTPKLTAEEVAKHNSASSCYAIVNASVYDLTSWISKHPGGQSAILSICGKDDTKGFMTQHGGQSRPEAALSSFKIGPLEQ